jgi:DNA gyrase/topoisomerase IV subunit A
LDEKDVLLSTNAGNVIRQPLSTVKLLSRQTKGVILMRLKNDTDKITSATLLDAVEDAITTS